MRSRLLALLALAVFLGCGPSFTSFRYIEKSRIIGATIRVTAEPERSTPAPGEEATLELLAADPGPREGRTYALVVCRPAVSALDIVFCSDPTQFVEVELVTTLPGEHDPKPNPSITFTVPDAATLGDADELWLQGAVCNGGTVRDLLNDPPVYGQAWDPCMPAAEGEPTPIGQLLTTRIQLERVPNDRNFRPRITSIELDGLPFTYTAQPDDANTGCITNMAIPKIEAIPGSRHLIGTRSTVASRESYLPAFATEPRREELYMRLFITAGGTSGGYGLIDDESSYATLYWAPPTGVNVDATGRLVRIYGQLVDERDASTPFERAVCVIPPAQ